MTKSCKRCGAAMPPDAYRTAKYCSRPCAKAARKAQWAGRPKPYKSRAAAAPKSRSGSLLACIVCAAPLPATASPNRRTCSDRCLAVHRAGYLREWYAQLKRDPDRYEAFLARNRQKQGAIRAREELAKTQRIVHDRSRR